MGFSSVVVSAWTPQEDKQVPAGCVVPPCNLGALVQALPEA